MTRLNSKKLNYLLSYQPYGIFLTTEWFHKHKYSKQIVSHYSQNGWLQKIGEGAYLRLNEKKNWLGAVCALQQQLKLPIHIAALTALELNGIAQNLIFNEDQSNIILFNTTTQKQRLPKWFRETFLYHHYYQHNLFENEVGLEQKEIDAIPITLSSPERAILELLDLVPNHFDYEHAKDSIRKNIYLSVISQILLRSIYELFKNDHKKYLEKVTINGFVSGIDSSTGKEIYPYIAKVNITRDMFNALNLDLVDPIKCLKHLKAQISKNPINLIPIDGSISHSPYF